jgi:RNA polymerase sigma-70 factor (ECF subfamily)
MTALALAVPDEATALQRAQAGDHDAFAELIGEHESMVFSIAYHFFHDRSTAEELAQDVFLELYRQLREIESPAHLLFWLRRVTANRCIDVVRKLRLRRVSLEDVELTTHDRFADPLLDRRLRQLLTELPDRQRIVVTLRYQEGLDPTEIGSLVDMPVNTVKSHLHRALAALRKKLGDL